MLDFYSNITSKHKIEGLDVNGMSISGGIATKFEYPALLDPKL